MFFEIWLKFKTFFAMIALKLEILEAGVFSNGIQSLFFRASMIFNSVLWRVSRSPNMSLCPTNVLILTLSLFPNYSTWVPLNQVSDVISKALQLHYQFCKVNNYNLDFSRDWQHRGDGSINNSDLWTWLLRRLASPEVAPKGRTSFRNDAARRLDWPTKSKKTVS